MTNKLRIFAVLAVVALAATFTACDKGGDNEKDGGQITVPNPSQQTQTANADETVAGNVTFTAKAAWTATVIETTPPSRTADGTADATNIPATRASGVEWVHFMVNGQETYSGAAGTVNATIELDPNYTGAARAATVTLKAGDGAGIPVTVTQAATDSNGKVPEPTYTVSASPSNLDFGSLAIPYTQPAAKTVTVTNTGTGTITLTQPVSDNYIVGTLSATNLAPGESARFTVRPKAGLAAGSYEDKLIFYPQMSQYVVPKFVVTQPFQLTLTSATFVFTTQTVGYTTPPAAQTVTVTNAGTQAGTITQPIAPEGYEVGTLSTTNLAPGASATFTVRPKAGLAVGLYNKSIIITGSNNAQASASLRFEVKAQVTPTYTISASPSNLDFGSLATPYTQPTAKTVTLTNTGTETVTLTQPESDNYIVGTLSATNLAPGATATFTVRPKANLAAGSYDEKMLFYPQMSEYVPVTFVVTQPFRLSLTSANFDFGSQAVGYTTQPAAQTVTVTNTGTQAGTITQPVAPEGYEVGTLSTTNLAPGASATFTVRPKANLAAGTYNKQIAITGSNNAQATAYLKFEVKESALPTYTISASPSNLDFGSLATPYTQPSAKTVTVTNTGTGSVTLTQPVSDNYIVGTLSATNLAPGATATFTVQPKAGLAVGSYEEKMSITASNGASETVYPQIVVTAPK